LEGGKKNPAAVDRSDRSCQAPSESAEKERAIGVGHGQEEGRKHVGGEEVIQS